MVMAGAFFYVFSGILVAAAFMVITTRNPVHAVLFLILAFFNAAGLFILMGAEFLAMMLVIVYVGAVMVLFLFVVMMLDVDFAELRAGFTNYLPVGGLIGVILLIELLLVVSTWLIDPSLVAQPEARVSGPDGLTNTEAFGRVLYTQYMFYFEVAGLILLVAMVGAIVLTLRQKEGVKRQDIRAQIARSPATAVEVMQVESGTAIFPEAEGGHGR
ncbi:MAG: NADH-quinone oxidoreductase subunit J [Hyphomicrobiaceae bacterium]